MKILRDSPVSAAARKSEAAWCLVHDMAVPLRYPNPEGKRLDPALADVSALQRLGLKGPEAAEWLASQGFAVPDRTNSWIPHEEGLVARLGRSEFLVEGGWRPTDLPQRWEALHDRPPAGIYPVLRQDCALLICGPRSDELMLQTCSVNLPAIPVKNREVILTSMIGVSVAIVKQALQGGHPAGADFCYRIWCDGTFCLYLWGTLLEIAADLGGGPIGLAELYPDAGRLPHLTL
jgi:sarcosine oxidase subunit gamma